MILTVTGCYSTGSSAVTDLVKECRDVYCKDDYEVRFAYDPDGIADLEYHLVENPNRHNTSHAIKKFMKMMNMLDHVYFIRRYRKHLGCEILPFVNEYVNAITKLRYRGIWHYDVYERGKLFYVMDSTYRNIRKILCRRLNFPLGRATLLPINETAYLGTTDEEEFLSATRIFTGRVVKSINKEGKRDIFLDQLVPPSNIERYERYFDDIRVIIVESDPRDLFILGRERLGARIMPVKDVNEFCSWYLWTRSIYERENYQESTLFIQFEDMIYDYEETKRKIFIHYGIDEERHVNKKKYFKPQISAGNTMLWKKFDGYSKEMEVIKRRLSKYCYSFPEKVVWKEIDRKGNRIF